MTSSMEKLAEVMDRLLGPDGCPWDREQDHRSLVRYLLEETYEVIDAIQEEDMNKLREELGDLLLQVVFHSALAKKEGCFDLDDVADGVRQKMISRHPHVFGSMEINSSEEVMSNWEGFKKKEGKKGVLDGIPSFLPALLRAYKLQEKARRVGFDWPDVKGALDKLGEEIEEVLSAGDDFMQLTEEMGDLFFALVNVARLSGIEPEEALQKANDKFARRFRYVERKAADQGWRMEEAGLEKLDALWDEAKEQGL